MSDADLARGIIDDFLWGGVERLTVWENVEAY